MTLLVQKPPDVFNMIVYFDVYLSLVKSYEFSSGYYGSNNVEKTKIDVISGAVDDIIFLMERLFYNETVEAAKENLKKEMVSWRLEEFLEWRKPLKKITAAINSLSEIRQVMSLITE